MESLKIEITPQSLCLIHAVRNEPIPQHTLDLLPEADRIEAEKYNEELQYVHWHVKDDNEHDLAYKTEQEADEFLNQLWLYLTASDEDRSHEVEADMVKCHNRACKVYVG